MRETESRRYMRGEEECGRKEGWEGVCVGGSGGGEGLGGLGVVSVITFVE